MQQPLAITKGGGIQNPVDIMFFPNSQQARGCMKSEKFVKESVISQLESQTNCVVTTCYMVETWKQ